MTGLALALSLYTDPHSPLQPKALYSWGVQLDLDLRSLPGWPQCRHLTFHECDASNLYDPCLASIK